MKLVVFLVDVSVQWLAMTQPVGPVKNDVDGDDLCKEPEEILRDGENLPVRFSLTKVVPSNAVYRRNNKQINAHVNKDISTSKKYISFSVGTK